MVRAPAELNAKFSPVFFSKRVYILEARVELIESLGETV